MLAIRFLRAGKKNQPFFRIVVTDKKNPPRGGRFLEILGFFNPLTKEKKLKAERIKYWLSVGAQPSSTVHNLLVKEKIIEGKKINVHKKSKKKPETDTEKKPEEKPASASAEASPTEAPATETPAKVQEAEAKEKPKEVKPEKESKEEE